MGPQRYRRRPEIVEAMRYDGSEESAKAIQSWIGAPDCTWYGTGECGIGGRWMRPDWYMIRFVNRDGGISYDSRSHHFAIDFEPLPDAAEAERLAGVVESVADEFAWAAPMFLAAAGMRSDRGYDQKSADCSKRAADLRAIAAMLREGVA